MTVLVRVGGACLTLFVPMLVIGSVLHGSVGVSLRATWSAADVPAEKADLLHGVHDRVTVAGPEIVGVRLTRAA